MQNYLTPEPLVKRNIFGKNIFVLVYGSNCLNEDKFELAWRSRRFFNVLLFQFQFQFLFSIANHFEAQHRDSDGA